MYVTDTGTKNCHSSTARRVWSHSRHSGQLTPSGMGNFFSRLMLCLVLPSSSELTLVMKRMERHTEQGRAWGLFAPKGQMSVRYALFLLFYFILFPFLLYSLFFRSVLRWVLSNPEPFLHQNSMAECSESTCTHCTSFVFVPSYCFPFFFFGLFSPLGYLRETWFLVPLGAAIIPGPRKVFLSDAPRCHYVGMAKCINQNGQI